ncbi:cytochrome C oxidase subunit IV family protein [Pullulanibacillus sp. KACC 23026]|uniref:cytochrome C oxidase subunit IV family protein n=1 Tax=Pullulanibacillus sp. KACC 23026 TaxID=3028315 RepID=UPI0023B1BDA9|nr:cytochrome C oxidase subunit IV family protein [Pullulanibacillus sp. KACC 23026]WEG11704.1 cytochrome C oxidase subunit IV family protein [Pullulanibacillus sp. KACC 23026]
MSDQKTTFKAMIEREQKKRDLQYYWVTFVSMIIFTVLAFLAVYFRKNIDNHLIAFFIVTLAVIQVAFQLFYFMHLKDKNHGIPSLFIFSGALVVFITVISFVTMIWIS